MKFLSQKLTCTEDRQQDYSVLLGHCRDGRGEVGHAGSADDYWGTWGHSYQHQTHLKGKTHKKIWIRISKPQSLVTFFHGGAVRTMWLACGKGDLEDLYTIIKWQKTTHMLFRSSINPDFSLALTRSTRA